MQLIRLLMASLIFLSSTAASEAHAESPPTRDALTALADRLEVMALSSRYAWGVDTLDRDYLANVFSEDAVAEYVGVGKNALDLNERLVGFDAIFSWLHENLKIRKGTDALPMHFVSNQLVTLRGDEADLTYYMRNRAASAGGVYYVKAVRIPEQGWRIRQLRLEEQTWKPEAYATDENAQKYRRKPGEATPE